MSAADKIDRLLARAQQEGRVPASIIIGERDWLGIYQHLQANKLTADDSAAFGPKTYKGVRVEFTEGTGTVWVTDDTNTVVGALEL